MILPTDIQILFTNYDIIAYFLNLASCSEHFISIKHWILATFNINKKNQFEWLYAFKVSLKISVKKCATQNKVVYLNKILCHSNTNSNMTSFKRVVKIIYIYTHCNLWCHRQFITRFYQFLHIRIEIIHGSHMYILFFTMGRPLCQFFTPR
jgi:hypothetical protein